jgi:hypothetical protein
MGVIRLIDDYCPSTWSCSNKVRVTNRNFSAISQMDNKGLKWLRAKQIANFFDRHGMDYHMETVLFLACLMTMANSSKRLASLDLYLRQINARLAFVTRIVADPQNVIVPDEAGVACVAAAGEK